MIKLSEEKKIEIQQAIKQVDAIWALEGFEKTEQSRQIDEAVLAGKVTRKQVIHEMIAYAQQHKTTHGFIESRSWV